MRLAVIGSRSFVDYILLSKEIQSVSNEYIVTEIVSGGAIGADSLAEKWAKANNVSCKVFLPDWKQFGKRAAYLRNLQIIKYCDNVLAFWDGKSPGTKMSIEIAIKNNKPKTIVLI